MGHCSCSLVHARVVVNLRGVSGLAGLAELQHIALEPLVSAVRGSADLVLRRDNATVLRFVAQRGQPAATRLLERQDGLALRVCIVCVADLLGDGEYNCLALLLARPFELRGERLILLPFALYCIGDGVDGLAVQYVHFVSPK